jgi:hypothetical protein
MWSSLDDHSQNPVTSFYESETDHCLALFIELFKHAADKIDFNVQSFLGNLPLHGVSTQLLLVPKVLSTNKTRY